MNDIVECARSERPTAGRKPCGWSHTGWEKVRVLSTSATARRRPWQNWAELALYCALSPPCFYGTLRAWFCDASKLRQNHNTTHHRTSFGIQKATRSNAMVSSKWKSRVRQSDPRLETHAVPVTGRRAKAWPLTWVGLHGSFVLASSNCVALTMCPRHLGLSQLWLVYFSPMTVQPSLRAPNPAPIKS